MGGHAARAGIDRDACGVGFIAQRGSSGSREVVERALVALARLAHRGGLDADGMSGDGAGILTAIPQNFFRRRAREAGIALPERFAVAMLFLPPGRVAEAREGIEAAAAKHRLALLGWRAVPVNHDVLGPRARAALPRIEQCFFAAPPGAADFERELFLARKRAEAETPGAYFCSLSSRTIVYKGLLGPRQMAAFYPDLAAADFASSFAVFHQRYSTNTQPAWRLAQPFRLIAHNGEINTLAGNRRWMRAREPALRRKLSAGDWLAALEENVSDSASFDNAYEILLRLGLSPAAALLRMAPPAWENDSTLAPELRAYLARQAHEQEPWDGPAALVASDGRWVAAKLDRNGLRPLRYTVTAGGLVVAGSEAGLADFRGQRVVERGRLGPGEMLLVHTAAGKLIRWRDLAALLEPRAARAAPTRVVRPGRAPAAPAAATPGPRRIAAALGWSEDQFRLLFEPLGREGKEAVWSMGDDAPPAFLSRARRPLWDYCKQRFAQVTNPPIDPLREAHVMALDAYLGRKIVAPSPVLDAGQMAALEGRWLKPSLRINLTFEAAGGVAAARQALARVREAARQAVRSRPGMVLVTDRPVSAARAALPALLGLAAAWKAMVEQGGWEVPLVVETGQVIETHHVAMLVAAGASAVFPYLAMELAESLRPGGAGNFRVAVEAGLGKVIARMGISTLSSYRNSQLFELVGLDSEVAAEFFEDAAATLGGKSLDAILEDSLARHAQAFDEDAPGWEDSGYYRFRQAGERHASSPELVRRLHRYVRAPAPEAYRAFAELAEAREPVAVRDLLEILPGAPVPLAEVESDAAILARFSTQAMSLGALGPEAHRALALAMNRLGARSNTGEGGEDPELCRREPEAANRVKQVASARFGVTAEYLVRADELEIKMVQGSKPGEGGQLPAAKVTPYIARLRHAVPGMALISPPPHHDIYSIEDLAQLIYDLRAVNPRARIGVKLGAGAGVGIIAAGVAKAGADVITICGFDGGTGASPLTSIKNTGLPWEVGLRDAHAALLRAGFRRRVRLRVDGGFKFGRDVVLAALLGADEFGFGTAALLAVGCVMARQCHRNTCPAGIATQDEKLRARFTGKPEMVIEYFRGVAAEVRERLAAMGARSLREIIGRVDRLRPRAAWAAAAFAALLEPPPEAPEEYAGLPEEARSLGSELARSLGRGSSSRRRVFAIRNADRSVGAHLSGELAARKRPAAGSAPLAYEFRGVAGQSFGAFLVPGVEFRLRGEANDYVGKGLSGGRIVIAAGPEASRRGDVLLGNTALYGATAGELYAAGRAGERFAVRNSGATAVVEGVGQHGCEYMTAGVVLLLGPAGINFGSGMTGGLAYLPRESLAPATANPAFVRPTEMEEEESEWVRWLLAEHVRLTGSWRGAGLLRAPGAPLVRLEPLRLPCSLAETWAATLERLGRRERPLERRPAGPPLETGIASAV